MDNLELIISFFAGGFKAALSPITEAIAAGFESNNKLMEARFMTLQEQLALLQQNQTLTKQEVENLKTAIATEREQVGVLIGAVNSQQETIAQLNTTVVDLQAALDAKTTEEQAAIDAVAAVTASAVQNTEEIKAAIASVQGIYEPAV